jgi:hypothetical protein
MSFRFPDLDKSEWQKVQQEMKSRRQEYYTAVLLPAVPDDLRNKITETCTNSDEALLRAIKRVIKGGGSLKLKFVIMNFPHRYFNLDQAVYEYIRSYNRNFVEEQVFPILKSEIKRRLESSNTTSIAYAFKIRNKNIKTTDFDGTWNLVVNRLVKKDTYNLEKYIRQLLQKVRRFIDNLPEYQAPEIPVDKFDAQAIINAYRFFKFAFANLSPQARIEKGEVPNSIFRMFFNDVKRILDLRFLLYFTIPAYVSAVLSGNEARKKSLEQIGIPEKISKLKQSEMTLLQEETKEYQNYFVFDCKFKERTFLEIYHELSSNEKMDASYFFFSQPLAAKNIRNAYVFLLDYMKRQNIPYPEFLAGYHAQCNIPSRIFEIIGLKAKDIIGLRERYFDVMPRIGNRILKKLTSISDAPEFMRGLNLTLDDYDELYPYLSRFTDYGVLDPGKYDYVRGLKDRAKSRITNQIFFNSTMLDPDLRDRDIKNILKLRKYLSKERSRSKFEQGDAVPLIVFHKFGVPIGDFSSLNNAVSDDLFTKEMPHFYFDKNILFDFADYVVFKKTSEINSVTLVYAVIRGEIKGTISTSCIAFIYNHLRWRLARPQSEGGMGYSEEQAENEAAQFTETYFLQPETPWNITTVDDKLLREAAKRRKLKNLSLEDAIEDSIFAYSSTQVGGPTIFITRDRDFENGVHPVDAVQSHRQVITKIIRRDQPFV